jgi:hypothetical protein
MPDGILPPIIQDFANVEARNKGVASYASGMAALVVAAAAIPDGLRLKAKVHEDWHEEARIWLALIGPVSAKKSPVLRAAMAPLKAAEEKAVEGYEADMAVYSLAKQKAEKNETECDLSEPDPPPQYILNDTTIEAAGDVLATNPQGVLLEHDELSGFFGSMDKYNSGRGSSADRAFWLRAWNGGPHKVNRRSFKGKPLRIPNLSVSVIGGIQPDTIRRVIKDCTDDGLIQRLIPVVIGPAKVGEDIPADKQTTAYKRLISRLVRLPEGTVRLSPDAQSIRRDLEVYLHGYSVVEDLSPRLAAFIGKLEGYFARLALTLHVCEAVDLSKSKTLLPSEVSADTAKRAGRLIREFIIPHAKHFYLDIASEGTELPQARAIAGYILAKGCKRFTFGDLTTNVHCCRKKTKDEVRRMIEPLEMFAWVEPEQVFDPRSWTVNPEVHIKFAHRAEEERARRESVHEKIREEAGHGQDD